MRYFFENAFARQAVQTIYICFESGKLLLTGPKGSKELTINDKIFSTSMPDDSSLLIKVIKKNEAHKILWGTTRSVINSAIIGVTTGHEKTLELTGVVRLLGHHNAHRRYSVIPEALLLFSCASFRQDLARRYQILEFLFCPELMPFRSC